MVDETWRVSGDRVMRQVARWDEEINGLLMADKVVAVLARRRIGSIEKALDTVIEGKKDCKIYQKQTCR